MLSDLWRRRYPAISSVKDPHSFTEQLLYPAQRDGGASPRNADVGIHLGRDTSPVQGNRSMCVFVYGFEVM